ncbi:serine/threonine-protein kinase [Micromonospora thermarum]|uniref:non-specific serine/threonine protein kinase n=1 Tax=Micromonospora thermarum TaxID=2720024 RepID=A0ABX0ZBW1_9ACTN|nr:serine/threonine-protein kinase [Micromonospora thermarum]NJP35412.1 protein kinase [Micromonospora thermarum]
MDTGSLLGGRYRLRERLGAGGMSVVWRAHDEVLGRDVAVKVLSPDLAADPQLLDRIRAEARSAARLRHPNIVAVYDYGDATGSGGRPLPYVVMEVVEGRSLAELLTGGALPWRVAVLICAQVAAALAAAHEQGVVHRDVTPGNVVVAGAGVRLVDFGISATSGASDAGGRLYGTPAYLAPERLERGAVRPATDVYALGLLLYRALAGRLPWRAATTTQMLTAHRYQEPTPLPEIADLPPEVSDLCRRCLDKEPDRRPSAAEIAEGLGSVVGLAPATLLLPQAGDGGAGTRTRTAVDLPGLVATAAAWWAGRPLDAPLRRWRHLPAGGRAAVAGTGAAVLVAAGVVVAAPFSRDTGQADRTLAAPPAAVAAMGERAPECTVRYTVRRAVDGRFAAAVSVANTGAVPFRAGRLTFALPGEQRLLQGSPGAWRQAGRAVQARIGDLPAKESRTATLEGTYRGVNSLPGQFQLDGTTCGSVLSVAGQNTPAEKDEQKGEDQKDEGRKDEEKKDEEKKDDD